MASQKLLKWGHGLGLLIPSFAAKTFALKPGSYVRVIVLEKEIRIRPVSAPKIDDLEPSEDEFAGRQVGVDDPKW